MLFHSTRWHMKLRKKTANIFIFFSILVFVLLMVIIPYMERNPIYVFDGQKYQSINMNGIISAFMSLICILIVCMSYKTGLIISLILMMLFIIQMTQAVVRYQSYSALPGIANALIYMIALTILSKQLQHRQTDAVTDILTGLLNRRGLIQYLESATKEKKPFTLLYVDIDDFKYINDNLGHKYGDQVLVELSRRMTTIIGEKAIASRLGGDEFVLILPAKEDVEGLTQNLLFKLNEKITLKADETENNLYLTASVGSVKYPDDCKDTQSLLKYADIALYEAKGLGKNKCVNFDKAMEQEIFRHAEVESIIKESLLKDYFYLVYQPQYEAGTKRLRGFETLIRLTMPDGTSVAPGEFISVAEKTDLIILIDEYVVNRALREFSEYMKSFNRRYTLSINVSAKNICRRGFADMVIKAVDKTRFPAECLEIEITEYCLVNSLDIAVENINKLKEFGIQIALDDFGTGYASLSYLSKLSVDLLKIDKSFIDDIGVGHKAEEFISAVITIGHLHGCKVISEGVEQENQLTLLQQKGCDFIQGFIWNKPLPYEEALNLAQNNL